MLRTILVGSFVSLAVVGCKTETSNTETPSPTPTTVAPSAEPAHAHEEALHDVACACTLQQECGNMIKVEGSYVPLEGDLGLDKMAFCGKTGLKAKVEGKLEDGKFVATSFELQEK